MRKIFLFFTGLIIAIIITSCDKESTTDDVSTSKVENSLNKQIELFNKNYNSFSTYNIISSGLTTNSNKDNKYNDKIIIDSNQYSELRSFLIQKIEFSLVYKQFIVTDIKGNEFKYHMVETSNLDYTSKKGVKIYTLTPENLNNRLICRAGCYALFAVMVASDGPAPIADIIAAIVLAECLDFCAQE